MSATSAATRIPPRTRPSRLRPWQQFAPWVAPLLTALLLAACTYVMFASHGASLI